MQSKLGQELAFITGAGVIIVFLAAGFQTPCGPGCQFMPMLVMAGGAGVILLAPLSGISRIICVIALLAALKGAHSEWNARERLRTEIHKHRTERLIKQLEDERAERFEKERAEWKQKSN